MHNRIYAGLRMLNKECHFANKMNGILDNFQRRIGNSFIINLIAPIGKCYIL